MDKWVIEPRFCGPTGTANGGYVCGALAHRLGLGGAVEVRLFAPPPLGRPLRVEVAESTVELHDDQTLVARATASSLELEVPAAPSYRQAQQMSTHYVGHLAHPFPRCFVCGPDRVAGDGLRIFAGSEVESPLVAAPWVPDVGLDDGRGRVAVEYLWSALDCPGYFAVRGAGEVALLGTMSAQIERAPSPGERCVVVAWALGGSGRKQLAATALFDAAGRLLGRAHQIWIQGAPR